MPLSKHHHLFVAIAVMLVVNLSAAEHPVATEGEPSGDLCILTMCVQLGKTKEVDALLQGGVKVVGAEKIGNMPLYYAILGDRPDCLYLILKYGGDPLFSWPGDTGGFPLAIAAQHGRVRCAAILLDHGAIVAQVDKRGHSSMYWAVIAQNLEVIYLLLKGGGRLNDKDISTLTPESQRWISEQRISVIIENR